VGGSFDRATGGGRHLSFEPRLAEARWLADTLGAGLHAMMDVSDGLGIDAHRMAAASNLSIELEGATLPLNVPAHSADGLLEAVSAGEDYELLFAAPASVQLPAACPVSGTRITRIGRCNPGPPSCTLVLLDGTRTDISTRGWLHG